MSAGCSAADQSGSGVLHTLETMKSGRRAASEETVTVVQSSEDQPTDKRMQDVSVHEPAELPDATHMKVQSSMSSQFAHFREFRSIEICSSM